MKGELSKCMFFSGIVCLVDGDDNESPHDCEVNTAALRGRKDINVRQHQLVRPRSRTITSQLSFLKPPFARLYETSDCMDDCCERQGGAQEYFADCHGVTLNPRGMELKWHARGGQPDGTSHPGMDWQIALGAGWVKETGRWVVVSSAL